MLTQVAKTGAYKYEDGCKYYGEWNNQGQKHGLGRMLFPDGTRYDGGFINGMCAGLGVLLFPDGAKYVFFSNKDYNSVNIYHISDTKVNLCKAGFMATEFFGAPMVWGLKVNFEVVAFGV